MMKVRLSRVVNNCVRYYSLEVLQNLFGEWLLVRSYGQVTHHPRMKSQSFGSFDMALDSLHHLLGIKMKKGYVPMATQGKTQA